MNKNRNYELPTPYPPYDNLNIYVVDRAADFLDRVGVNLKNKHTSMAPYRLTHYLRYLLNRDDDRDVGHLTTFDNVDPIVTNMVRVPDIPFWSACGHHLLPFTGYTSVAYVPDKKIIGLSKIALLVRSVARGFWMQEHLANAIADELEEHLQPLGVAVLIRAQHTCQLLDLKQPPIPWMETPVLRGDISAFGFRSQGRHRGHESLHSSEPDPGRPS